MEGETDNDMVISKASSNTVATGAGDCGGTGADDDKEESTAAEGDDLGDIEAQLDGSNSFFTSELIVFIM